MMRNIVLKYVLKNALEFGGKANSKVVLGAVLKENPNLKKDVPLLMKEIDMLIKEVGEYGVEEIKRQLVKEAPELLSQKKEVKVDGPLKPLPNAIKGKLVVRIAPSPSGPLHIGHAYGVSLNSEYAKMYEGRLILRIEDTNPENIYPQAYELIERDARWLTDNNIAQVVIQSSRLGIYYDYAEQLIRMGKAYLCTCEAEFWREQKNRGIPCPCRSLSVKENQERYGRMFNSYAEGEVVVRLKTDIKHKNPAMRDFGIMRIVEHVHPKTGKTQRVWPLMLFAVAIDDHELGITHVLNGKDHTDNAMKERMIMDCFNWTYPEYKHWGMINFEGFDLSTSKTRRAIECGEYHGWEDIRIPFMPALRKRGYQPEAFRRFALETGLSLNDKTVSIDEFWKMINAFDKEMIEKSSNRYFFVDKPVKIKVDKCRERRVMLDLHPDFPERGKRGFHVAQDFYICASDVERLEEGKIHRLMDCCNFRREREKYTFISESYDDFKNASNKGIIIHWLSAQETILVEVMMNDGETIYGLGEHALAQCKEGDIVQLERRYFARVEKNTKDKVILWYLHT